MKKVVAVDPYKRKGGLVFQQSVFEAWRNLGGETIHTMYPPRILHHFISHYDYIHFKKNAQEARLIFTGGGCPEIMAFPNHINYEIIPMMWDCWPNVFDKVCSFLRRNNVQTAIFTSSMTADLMKKEFPQMNILAITEGIEIDLYKEGKNLSERNIDLIEFGRINQRITNSISLDQSIKHLYSKNGERLFPHFEDLVNALSDSKISVTLPRCDTHPEMAGNIETLTQRYWECMLSRVIMIGRAPFELINLIGYNPVIEIDNSNSSNKIEHLLNNIDTYQELVNKNRKTALKLAGWETRIREIREFLTQKGYII